MSDIHGKLVEWADRFADGLARNAAARPDRGVQAWTREPGRLPRHP